MVKASGTFKPPKFDGTIGGAAPEGAVPLGAEAKSAKGSAERFQIDLDIAFAAAEMAVKTTDKETGIEYILPLPSPIGFGPFSEALDKYQTAFNVEGAKATNTLCALARMIWILEHQAEDGFDPRDIPEGEIMLRLRALDWRAIVIYQTLIVSAAQRLGEVMGFSKRRVAGVPATTGKPRARRSGSGK